MKLQQIVNAIKIRRRETNASCATLVGISGIDASGKGFVSQKVTRILESNGLNVALINVDGWLNLPNVRFSADDPARHFYEHALRLDQMFDQLILPLKANSAAKLTADLAEETATDFAKHEYVYNDIDVILLEGIFIFKRMFVDYFDLKIWIDCSFKTALKRAVARSQEGLSAAQTNRAYNDIYFPAQRIHFEKDTPQKVADLIVAND
jgi:uridine kinase